MHDRSRNVTDSPTPDELMRREREDNSPVTRREFREVRNAVMAMKAAVIGEDEYRLDPSSLVAQVRDHSERITSLEAQRSTHRKITWAAVIGGATAAGASAWSFITSGKHP